MGVTPVVAAADQNMRHDSDRQHPALGASDLHTDTLSDQHTRDDSQCAAYIG
jgi:hypothetical protein